MTSVSNARKLVTWHATALISDVLTVTTMDMLPQIALIRYHPQVHQHTAGTTPLVDVTDLHLGIIATPCIPTMIIGTDTDSVIPNPTHITFDTEVIVTMTPAEVAPRHFTDPPVIVLHTTRAQDHIATATNTPHHRSSSCRNFSRDDSRCRMHKSTKHHYKPTQKSSSSSLSTSWKPKDRKHKQVTIDDPPPEYYSSDEQDSDSEDDLN